MPLTRYNSIKKSDSEHLNKERHESQLHIVLGILKSQRVIINGLLEPLHTQLGYSCTVIRTCLQYIQGQLVTSLFEGWSDLLSHAIRTYVRTYLFYPDTKVSLSKLTARLHTYLESDFV